MDEDVSMSARVSELARIVRSSKCTDEQAARATKQVEGDGRVDRILGDAVNERVASDGGRDGEDRKRDEPQGRIFREGQNGDD